MCGRFVQYSDPEIYASRYDIERSCEARPRYNLAPTQSVLAVRRGSDGKRELVPLRWGLVPAWSKRPDNRYSMINARAETVASKPAYRSAFKARRCLIPAEGFYEWRATASGKQPYFIHRIDNEPFAMAGLWERWSGSEDGPIESCTIIVTDANPVVSPIHDRMPVVLDRDIVEDWLDPDNRDTAGLTSLLRTAPGCDWSLTPISRHVNSPRNDGPELLEPFAPDTL